MERKRIVTSGYDISLTFGSMFGGKANFGSHRGLVRPIFKTE